MDHATDTVPTRAIETAREAFREAGGQDNPWALVNALAAALPHMKPMPDLGLSVATCPKCGCASTYTAWRAEGQKCGTYSTSSDQHGWASDRRAERFHRDCWGCHYEWDTYDVMPDPS